MTAIQFLGFEAHPDDALPETRYQWARARWSEGALPTWAQALADAGRLLIDGFVDPETGRLASELQYCKPGFSGRIPIFEGCWIVRSGEDTAVVVTDEAYQAVRSLDDAG